MRDETDRQQIGASSTPDTAQGLPGIEQLGARIRQCVMAAAAFHLEARATDNDFSNTAKTASENGKDK